jgi:hypothetical protein
MALDQNNHGLALEQKHMRVALVITPSVSYFDNMFLMSGCRRNTTKEVSIVLHASITLKVHLGLD